jgi:chromosome segregation ATPase
MSEREERLEDALKASQAEGDRLRERLKLQPADLEALGTKLDEANRKLAESKHYLAISRRVVQEQWDKLRDASDKLRNVREEHSTNHHRVLRAAEELQEYIQLFSDSEVDAGKICQGIARAMLIAADDVKE